MILISNLCPITHFSTFVISRFFPPTLLHAYYVNISPPHCFHTSCPWHKDFICCLPLQLCYAHTLSHFSHLFTPSHILTPLFCCRHPPEPLSRQSAPHPVFGISSCSCCLLSHLLTPFTLPLTPLTPPFYAGTPLSCSPGGGPPNLSPDAGPSTFSHSPPYCPDLALWVHWGPREGEEKGYKWGEDWPGRVGGHWQGDFISVGSKSALFGAQGFRGLP